MFGSSPAGRSYPIDHMLNVVRKSVGRRATGRPGDSDPLGPAPPSKPGDYDPINRPSRAAARRKKYLSA